MSNNSSTINNDTETTASHKVLPVPFLKAFATQTDWNSLQTLESWYGHHSPLLRTLALTLLFITASSLYHIAIGVLPAAWNAGFQSNVLAALATKQAECAKSLCGVVQDMQFNCEIDQDGMGAKMLRLNSINGTDEYSLPWSPACQEAIQETEKLLFPQITTTNFSFAHLLMTRIADDNGLEEDVEHPVARPSLTTIHPSNCSVSLSLSRTAALILPSANLSSRTNEELSNETVESDNIEIPLLWVSNYNAGDVVENVLDLYTCSHAIPNNARAVLAFLSTIYTIVMGPALFFIVALLIVMIRVVYHCFVLFTTTVHLLFTTALVRFCFTWPKDYCDGFPITYGSTLQMMLLLCTLSTPRTGDVEDIVFACILAMTAYRTYNNNQAAMEWLQLGILWYGWFSLIPYLDAGANSLEKLDGLGIVRFVGGCIACFVPGVGWWKLIRVYIFWRAFPRLSVTRNGDIECQWGMHID